VLFNFHQMRYQIFTCLLLFATSLFGQETWSLERCVKYAQETNITIQQAQLALRNAQLDMKQSKAARNPSLSAQSNLGTQLGRTIDPRSNDFISTQVGFNNLSLNANLNLYQGGAIKNGITQSNHLVQAAQADLERAANDVGLLVAQSYLNILLAEEQLKNAQSRVSQSRDQLRNTRKFIEVGTLPAIDSLNVIAQLTRDQQIEISAQNNLDLTYLSLRQLLQVEPEKGFRIEDPAIIIPEESYLASLQSRDIYSAALTTQPAIRAGESRLRAAHTAVAVAKSNYYPTVGLFGQLSSNYSTAYKNYDFLGTGKFSGASPIVFTTNGGRRDTGLVANFIPDLSDGKTVAYPKQVGENFGQAFGLTVQVPIYQNGRTKIGVQRAKLNIKAAELENERSRQQLRSDIQTSLANARAALNQFKAAEATREASRLAFENMKKRHALGAVNTLELTTTRNNLTLAENDVTVARYDYIFKVKILDFYLGRKIKLN
jgi:outer membrane protein